jgi:integrase
MSVTAKGSRTERLPLPAPAGEALAAWLAEGRPACESRAVFVTVRRPCRQLRPEAVRAIIGRACDRAGLERRGSHPFRHALATEMLCTGASLPGARRSVRADRPAVPAQDRRAAALLADRGSGRVVIGLAGRRVQVNGEHECCDQYLAADRFPGRSGR